MDLESDVHNTPWTEVVNLPVMVTPEIYNLMADIILSRLENNNKFQNILDARISAWMDRNFIVEDYVNLSDMKEDIRDSIRYDLKDSIHAEVQIYVD